MVTILAKLFIKNSDDYLVPTVREKYGVLCGLLGIFFNVVLFGIKFLAGTLSGSIAITADAFNNLSDAGSSFITLIGFKLGGQKPDPEHPFGHGRLEYLSGLAVSVLILIMAFELIKGAIDKIMHPALPECSPLIIVILVVSIAVKFYMAVYNNGIGKKIDSAAMLATSKDSLSDTISTFVVLLSTVIGALSGLHIDGFCGVLVGLFVAKAGIDSVKDTIGPLLGEPPTDEFVESIKNIVSRHEVVLGIHDMVVHDYGPGRVMVSLHAEVPYKMDIMYIHDEIDNIESELRTELNCEAVIHMDPVVDDDPEINSLKQMVAEVVKDVDDCLMFHDFRVVKGPTHVNLIFDVVAPFKFSMTDEEIKTAICSKVSDKRDNTYCVILVDHSYLG